MAWQGANSDGITKESDIFSFISETSVQRRLVFVATMPISFELMKRLWLKKHSVKSDMRIYVRMKFLFIS